MLLWLVWHSLVYLQHIQPSRNRCLVNRPIRSIRYLSAQLLSQSITEVGRQSCQVIQLIVHE